MDSSCEEKDLRDRWRAPLLASSGSGDPKWYSQQVSLGEMRVHRASPRRNNRQQQPCTAHRHSLSSSSSLLLQCPSLLLWEYFTPAPAEAQHLSVSTVYCTLALGVEYIQLATAVSVAAPAPSECITPDPDMSDHCRRRKVPLCDFAFLKDLR